MTNDRRNLSDEELGKLLRLGDPVGDGREPSCDEIAAMRRTVLNAVDTRAATRPWLSRSLVTAAATVAVALIALAILLQAGPWGEVLQPETGPATPAETAPATAGAEASSQEIEPQADPGAATGTPTPAVPTEAVAAVEEAPEAVMTEPSRDPATVGEAPVDPEAPPTLAAVEEAPLIDPLAVEREPRTVHFTTPGGTRIIWTLDPDFELPVSEPDTRARGEM